MNSSLRRQKVSGNKWRSAESVCKADIPRLYLFFVLSPLSSFFLEKGSFDGPAVGNNAYVLELHLQLGGMGQHWPDIDRPWIYKSGVHFYPDRTIISAGTLSTSVFFKWLCHAVQSVICCGSHLNTRRRLARVGVPQCGVTYVFNSPPLADLHDPLWERQD